MNVNFAKETKNKMDNKNKKKKERIKK